MVFSRIRLCPRYVGGILKRIQLYFYGQSNLSRKRSFSKSPIKPEKFENAGFEFLVDGKFLKPTLSNVTGSGEPRDLPGRDFLKQKYKTSTSDAFLNCSSVVYMRTTGPKLARLLMKSTIRRRSSQSPKRKKNQRRTRTKVPCEQLVSPMAYEIQLLAGYTETRQHF